MTASHWLTSTGASGCQSYSLLKTCVDSSIHGYGAILLQISEEDQRIPARFMSGTWNHRERNYSQAKLELFGLFRALYEARIYLVGLDHFFVEVDASYIKGMINNPDLQPNATINRWIAGILLFNFTIIHTPASRHLGPDGLSRRGAAPSDPPRDEDFEDWIDHQYSFLAQSYAAASTDHPKDSYQLPQTRSSSICKTFASSFRRRLSKVRKVPCKQASSQ